MASAPRRRCPPTPACPSIRVGPVGSRFGRWQATAACSARTPTNAVPPSRRRALTPESAAKRLPGGRGVRMILDVGDTAVLHRQNLRPPMRVAVAVGPRERDRDAVVDLLDRVDPQPAVTTFDTPAERGPEDLTGLVGPVSGRDGSPETPAPASPAPLHLGPHERDERLDVSLGKGAVRRPNLVNAHDRHATKRGSRLHGRTPDDARCGSAAPCRSSPPRSRPDRVAKATAPGVRGRSTVLSIRAGTP